MFEAVHGPDPWRGEAIDRPEPFGLPTLVRPASAAATVAILLGRFGTGGVERVACHLANGFAGSGLRTRILCAREEGPARAFVAPDVAVTPLARARRALPRALTLAAALPALVRDLRRNRPGLLLSPGNHTHLVAAIAHRLCGRDAPRLVLKMTNPVIKRDTGPVARGLRRAFYRWAFARADRILLLSERDRAGIAAIDPAALAKATVVANPYVAAGAAGASDPATDSATPTILVVGRLDRQKNHARLFRALARIADRDWRLSILGTGPYEARLKQLAAELGIANRITFHGFVADPWPAYRGARLLAISSDWEGLPAVAIEAMAVGCPVVATDCAPALTAVVQESGFGRIADGFGDEALAAAISAELATARPRQAPPQAAAFEIGRAVAAHARELRAAMAAPVADAR